MAYIPLTSFIVSVIFAILVLDQYFARRKSFQLVWAIGLLMYGIGAFTEFYTERFGLHDLAYRLWYFFGAICSAAYLGQGTVQLLMRGRRANIFLAILLAATIYAAVYVFTVSIDLSSITTLTGGVMPANIRLLTGLFNIYGTVALVGGAAWSAWIFWRKRILPYRVVSNILIALGAMMPALGGSLLVAGSSRAPFYSLELAGIVIIFLGFLRNKEVFGIYRFPLIHGFKKLPESKQ